MNVVYITIIGLVAVIAGWLAQALKEAKESLAKVEADMKATEEGMDELVSMMHDQSLTIEEYRLLTEAQGEKIGRYSHQVVEYEEQIETLEKEVGRLEKKNAEQEELLELHEEGKRDYQKLLDIAQARARDLETTVTFHANNCLPVLDHIRAANG